MVKPMSDAAGDWDAFALLLIDVQEDFWTEVMSIAFPDYGENVASLLALCRNRGIDVVHLRAQFREDQSDWMVRYRLDGEIPCIENTAGAKKFGYATEAGDEPVILKQTFDGFLNDELQEWLQANGKRYLLVAGLVTSVCVLLTAAAAAQRGYLVSIVEDCCADKPEAHVETLERYPFIFDVTSIDDVVASHDDWMEKLAKIGN
jgi:nicotinamidase-related amidase